MGKRIMYGDSSSSGWDGCKVYNENNIDIEVLDSNNTKKNKSKVPKVSVPSPFARFELVQKAFGNIALHKDNADMRDRILVSHALDLAQLFYEGIDEGQGGFEIVKWNKSIELGKLKKSSSKGHQLLGNSLELYMRQENYGFNERKFYSSTGRPANDMTIYIITYNGDAIGCTSPTSLFLATPNFYYFNNGMIKIQGDKPLFGKTMALCERDEAFIEYMYKFMASIKKLPYQDEQNPLSYFKDYMEEQKDIIRIYNPNLYQKINNLDANYDSEQFAQEYYQTNISVLGYTLYRSKKEEIGNQIQTTSDFVIESIKAPNKPLVLSNNCNYNNWAYISNTVVWNKDKHSIDYDNRSVVLPGTDIEYKDGWLCENDFLSDVIIQLPYPLNKSKFFDGNVENNGIYNYLLPIKSRFFKYFDYSHLLGKNGSMPNFRMVEDINGDEVRTVTVYLAIPVKGGKPLVLKKIYKPSDSAAEGLNSTVDQHECATGSIVECSMAMTLFPFVQMEKEIENSYNAQLMKSAFDMGDFDIYLKACQSRSKTDDDYVDESLPWDPDKEVIRSKDIKTYSIANKRVDYFTISIEKNISTKSRGDIVRKHEAVVIPMWGEPQKGVKSYKFSFDFGTTNSHMAVYDVENRTILDLKLKESSVSTVDLKSVSKYSDISASLFPLYVRQEFIPEQIGEIYSFPLRTVVLKSNSIDDSKIPEALKHVNIPFIYGKEDYAIERNTPIPNIKWSLDGSKQKYANSFIEELVILAKAYTIENNGDLSKCHFSWTYPLSMGQNAVDEFNEKWKEYYKKYFNPALESIDAADSFVTNMTESIAPLLYYIDTGKAISQMSLSIDIGGGTCDVVVHKNESDVKINSFRFAADVIFGAGKAIENPMIQHHYKTFLPLIPDDSDGRKLRNMLERTAKNDESTEANSMLFSMEKQPLLAYLSPESRSYNLMLKKDRRRKIVFLYFYAAIINYLTRLLIAHKYPQPKILFFSGTGSKLLNIIGSRNVLKGLTTEFVQAFSDDIYKYEDDIEIVIEEKEPKQLTAKGALCDNNNQRAKEIAEGTFGSRKAVQKNTVRYNMIEKPTGEVYNLKYEDFEKSEVKDRIVESVKSFNKKFESLIKSLDFVESYGCDEESINIFLDNFNKDLKDYLDTEFKDNFKIVDKNRDKDFEDALFFYPVKGIIQRRLIPKL